MNIWSYDDGLAIAEPSLQSRAQDTWTIFKHYCAHVIIAGKLYSMDILLN